MKKSILSLFALLSLMLLLVSCETPSEIEVSSITNKLPTLSLTSNAATLVFAGNDITFTAAANDADGKIVKVEFYIDNALTTTLTAPNNSGNYIFVWTAGPSSSTHAFKVVAYDDLGAKTTATKDIVVSNKLPAITLTHNAPAQVFNGDVITFTTTANDSDGTISKVEFFVDGILKSTVTAPTPASTYLFVWTAAPSGTTHEIKAVAYDNINIPSIAAAKTIIVDNKAPICKITEPANGSTIYPTETTTIKAVIYDLDGQIVSYKFMINGTEVPANLILPVQGNDTTFYYQGTMLGVLPNANNAYVITASAKDDAGKETNQEFILNAGNRPPSCQIGVEGLVEGYFNVGDQVKITCNATDPGKNSKSIAKVEFKIRGQLVATDTEAPYEYVWNTTADNQITVSNTIQVTAYDNNNVAASASDDTILVKNSLPAITSITPVDGSIIDLIDANTKFSIKLDDAENKIDSVIVIYGNEYRPAVLQSKKSAQTWELSVPTSQFPQNGFNYMVRIVDHYNNSQNNGIVKTSQNNITMRLFYDGFENYADFDTSKVLGSRWTQKDLDKGTTYSITGYYFPNQAYKGAYIIFNPNSTLDTTAAHNPNPMASTSAHSGNKFASCIAASSVKPNNDWIITNKISGIAANGKLSFWAKSKTAQYGLEKFCVYVSETGTNVGTGIESQAADGIKVGDFKKISAGSVGVSLEAPATAWTKYDYDLSAFAGKQIHIAVTCRSNDAFMLMLDDFSVYNGAKMKDVSSGKLNPPVRVEKSIKKVIKK